MNSRLLATVALLLILVVGLAIHQIGREPLGAGAAAELVIGDPEAGFAQKSPIVGELTLVRTPDSEFLNQAPVDIQGEPVASDATGATQDTAEQADEAQAGGVAPAGMGGDAKAVEELGIAGADGKEFKEIIDPKGLPPIADGSEAGGGVGGGGGGGIGGGGGGGAPSEVAAFEEVIEVEKDGDTIIQNGRTTVINRTIVRTVPQAAPVTPVPELGNAFTGFAVAAISFAALLRRQRAGFSG